MLDIVSKYMPLLDKVYKNKDEENIKSKNKLPRKQKNNERSL